MWIVVSIAVFVGIPILGFVALLYVSFARQASGNPKEFLRHGGRKTSARVVVCAGDSLTHASLSADYVEMLRSSLGDQGHQFVNAGINGDSSQGLLRRLNEIVACHPDAVTIQIGTNEARVDPVDGGSLEAFRNNVEEIVTRLRAQTSARIAVISIPPLGEDLEGDVNLRVGLYNSAIKQVAAAHRAAYLPLNEVLIALIRQSGQHDQIPFKFRIGLILATGVRHYGLRQSFDHIAAQRGFVAHTDQIHLNGRGAAIVADLIEEWLTSTAPTQGQVRSTAEVARS